MSTLYIVDLLMDVNIFLGTFYNIEEREVLRQQIFSGFYLYFNGNI
jgi:hypothetical protein